jgi:hypothetical protein
MTLLLMRAKRSVAWFVTRGTERNKIHGQAAGKCVSFLGAEPNFMSSVQSKNVPPGLAAPGTNTPLAPLGHTERPMCSKPTIGS